ncbi:accessory Sec system protein translocase subunit SecY2 [Staphylococcus haemolyticus]|uniref:accessory Sec system protein translocase subunit SecY2 n=1 Tax=Staphylococcus haemolyticus TaxID=1283 RepID=UPI001F58DF24|nr:accessory Sec system protein translocase subunit SecY2 [Staphylococcus haemolyticus]MCI2944493.1 accessory Sec system protein translocase subunit SecY2 [Staphylococcus haemolyticus]MCI2946794.1 accessory Sec system protein translocase subunit SecY2 [Staphylococcus haemolyticus]
MLKNKKIKILHKRIIFTITILAIYIFGSNISIIGNEKIKSNHNSFLKFAISNVGGDLNSLNVFSLGLGPWLTAMIIIMLFKYRDIDNIVKQTQSEKQLKEKLLTIFIASIQAYYVIHTYVQSNIIQNANILLLIMILLTGTLLLVWLADQNTTYGIGGPMPIVLMSLIKSLFHQQLSSINITPTLFIVIGLLVIAMLILLYIELSEYRLYYKDIMNMSTQNSHSYLSWKLNPAGSISIMISLSIFLLLNNIINLIGNLLLNKEMNVVIFGFDNHIGITVYIVIQIIFGYLLSRFLINTKRKAKEFLKNGNYFININPGEETEKYLNKKARIICWFGSITVALILAVPLYCSLLIPELSKEIYFSIQLIILIYIGISITETLRAYSYFDRYKNILDKY